jgi:hypothetical protein
MRYSAHQSRATSNYWYFSFGSRWRWNHSMKIAAKVRTAARLGGFLFTAGQKQT